MNKNYFNALLFFTLQLVFINMSNGQGQLTKQWDYRYGGLQDEKITTFLNTNDGGYLLGGYTNSDTTGDITQITNGGIDMWVVKLNANGLKQWERRYGGAGSDLMTCGILTPDGGYLLGGFSSSGIGGDKTQPCWGFSDYWIVKIDSAGMKQWDKRFGSFYTDELASICAVNDGGYLLGGTSDSPMGGDKSDSSWGFGDYWVVKIDAGGSEQWDKRYGGTTADHLSCVRQTSDLGFLLAGFSNSDSTGNKSQNTFGGYDYWVIKTDSSGNIVWDKNYGGTFDDELFSMITTSGNEFVIAGWAYSQANGNKSQPTKGLSDYWIVNVDASGSIIWDKDYGGSNTDDDLGNIIKTVDGGFLITCTSYSFINGDKSEPNLGIEQAWLLKLDMLGNKEWDKTIFSNGHDEASYAVQAKEGCYTIAIQSNAGTGGYKTQTNWDPSNTFYDYWVIAFCDSTEATGMATDMLIKDEIKIIPNPFSNEISIKLPKKNDKEISVILRDIFGRNLFKMSDMHFINSDVAVFNFSSIPEGLYFMEIIMNGKRSVTKIIKQ